ncbi:hypothetical protein KCU81_g646, partial [Aureobasidium melanogenum]
MRGLEKNDRVFDAGDGEGFNDELSLSAKVESNRVTIVGLLKENWLDAGDMIGEAGSCIDSTLAILGKFLYEAL